MSNNSIAELMIANAREKGDETISLSCLNLTSVPKTIGQLVNVKRIDLHTNALRSLPEEITELPNLKELSLQDNYLASLPATIGNLKQLEMLQLYNNKLSSLPEEIGFLYQLKKFDLDNNCLTHIPEQIGHLIHLIYLRLERNYLKLIPDSVGNLKELQMLTLSGNALTKLPTSLRKLDNLKYLYVHDNDALAIPQNILGPEIWNVRTSPSKAKNILNWYFASNRLSPQDADELEEKARSMLKISGANNRVVYELLNRVVQCDSSRTKRIKDEFGFLYATVVRRGATIDEAEKKRFEWRRQIWRVLGSHNGTQIKISESENRIDAEKAHSRIGREQAKVIPYKKDSTIIETHEEISAMSNIEASSDEKQPLNIFPSQNQVLPLSSPPHSIQAPELKGETLERAVVELLKECFVVNSEQSQIIIDKLRQQKRGDQGGHDIEFSFFTTLALNNKIRCHVECKNVKEQITKLQVLDKLEAYVDGTQKIDLWILISPRSNPSNDLNALLPIWERERRYPFKVQIWSPENHVDEFFGLHPESYDLFYLNNPAPHPRNWTKEYRLNVLKRWEDKLKPPLRVNKPFEDYIRNPLYLCFRQERHLQMDALFHNHVDVFGLSEAGVMLTDQTLEAHVKDWLKAETPNAMFLLGEFGDGKTAFTYNISRKLLNEFKDDPTSGWIPIRFALRDFSQAGNSRKFLQERLADFRAGLGDWNELRHQHKIMVILDGFDEMSRQLDRESVSANISSLKSCFDEFFGCKILVTSRTHFFAKRRDKQVLFSWATNPLVYQLAPLSRKTVNNFLSEMVSGPKYQKTLAILKTMHDPIGLGTKPLFLQMLKETLEDLPEDIDVVTLYETYVRKVLERKIEFLEQGKSFGLTREELIENIDKILQEIALKFQISQEGFVSLSSLASGNRLRFAKILWQSSDPDFLDNGSLAHEEDAESNALAQVGARSLLTRVNTPDMEAEWTVDFCHRSVREYFVACGIVSAIRGDLERACNILRDTPLNHEILDFIVMILKRDNTFDGKSRLMELLNLAVLGKNPERLGGHALTLLYRMTGVVPGEAWQGKALDFVDLTGADLSNKDFSKSTLRNANLDNVNLERSNFSDCDLTGVRLEETSSVKSLAVISENRFLVAYADGCIREWDISHPQRSKSRIIWTSRGGEVIDLGVQTTGDVWTLQDGQISFYDWTDSKNLSQTAHFSVRRDIRDIRLGTALVGLMEVGEMHFRPLLFNPEKCGATLIGPMLHAVFCVSLGMAGFVVYESSRGLNMFYESDSSSWKILELCKQRISCLNVWFMSSNTFLVGAGQENGQLRVWKLSKVDQSWRVAELLNYAAHKGYVSSLAFLNEDKIVSGGQDRTISICGFGDPQHAEAAPVARKLVLTLRCQGMNIENLQGEREFNLLQQLISRERQNLFSSEDGIP